MTLDVLWMNGRHQPAQFEPGTAPAWRRAPENAKEAESLPFVGLLRAIDAWQDKRA